MNKSELVVFEWLKTKYKPEDIQKKVNPDFVCPDESYEVKKLYGDRLIVSTKQVGILNKVNPMIMVVADNNRIVERFRWSDIKKSGYKLTMMSGVAGATSMKVNSEFLEELSKYKIHPNETNQSALERMMENKMGGRLQQLENMVAKVTPQPLTPPSFMDKLKTIEQEKMKLECDATNIVTLKRMLETVWVPNIIKNLPVCQNKKTIHDIPKYEKPVPAIIIGGSTSLTDEQIRILKGFDGIKICTNKNLKRVLEQDIVPDWVTVIHTTPDIYDDFNHDIIRKHSKNIKVVCGITCDPKVTGFIDENFDEKYWAMPVIDPTYLQNVSRLLSCISGCDEVATMGNVGGMSYLLASDMGCNPVGLLGMDMSFPLNPKWNDNDLSEISIFYNPSITSGYGVVYYKSGKDFVPMGQLFILDRPFKIYVTHMINTIMSLKKEKKMDTINLSPFGMLRRLENKKAEDGSLLLPFMSVEDFVEKYKKVRT